MEASEYFQQLVDRTVSLVVDDVEAAAMGRSLGFPVTLFDEYSFSEKQERPALVVITQTASIPRLHALWGQAAAPFCHLALAKFDGSAASLAYALQRLLSADAAAALGRRAATYEQMLSRGISLVRASSICVTAWNSKRALLRNWMTYCIGLPQRGQPSVSQTTGLIAYGLVGRM